MADEGHKPTSGMKSAAKRALAWHKDGKRGGTSVGYARANQIVSGESLSDDTVKRMYSFFSRHEVDKKAKGFNSGEEGYPSPGRVAWDLWGGDSGFAFARSKVKHTLKKEIISAIEKTIGNNSSKAHDPIEEPGHVEYYVRGGEKNMSEEIVEKASTEPDPEGDIAVLKSANSDLARSDIEKAIEALTAIAKSLPDVSRASDVTVDNETLEKSNDPEISRAGDVTVSNETGPVAKNVGDPDDVVGQGENSKPANEPVDRPQGVVTKSVCGEDDCTGDDCDKCMGKNMEMEMKNMDMEMVEKSEHEESAEDAKDDEKAEGEIKKSVWGGAFGPTHQVTIGVFQK
jgi:hypothetical protein